jgi:hypothetical protein
MLFKFSLLVLLIGTLSGCVAQPQPRHVQFNQDEYTPYGAVGSAIIYGETFLKTRGGDVKKAAGNKVFLNPVTTYSTEWFDRQIIGNQLLTEGDQRARPYFQETVADSDGRFQFENLTFGDYYLACAISWEVPDGYGHTSVTGGWAYAKVNLKAGEHKKVVLTR